jgi:hypothetical protein
MGDEYACGGLIGERTWWGKNTTFLNFTVLVLLSWIESSAREWEWKTEWWLMMMMMRLKNENTMMNVWMKNRVG